MRVVALLAVVGACGRVDFDPLGECTLSRLVEQPYANSQDGADGTSEHSAFLICTEAQLDQIGEHPEHWASWFRVGADIELTQPVPMIGGTPGFTGVFDGGGHTIANLARDLPTTNNVGLFAAADAGARFANVTLTNVDVHGAKSVGALVGAGMEITVDNVHVDGALSGDDSVGGLIGIVFCDVSCAVTNSSATVDIDANGDGAGIVGIERGSAVFQLSQLTSSGRVTGAFADSLAGIIGFADWIAVDSCTSSMRIDAYSDSGGVAGTFNSAQSTITASSASGDVTCARYFCGGLVGAGFGSVARSHASGNVTCGDRSCGGLAGATGGPIVESYATGNVMGVDFVGGLLGSPDSTDVHDCYATGQVSGATEVGGLVGWMASGGTIARSYSTSRVMGKDQTGGLVGFGGSGTETLAVLDSFATGDVTGESSTNLVSQLVADATAGSTTPGSFYNVASTCTNALGSCTVDAMPAPGPDYFYDPANAPLSQWDFSTVWQTVAGGFPQLR